MVDDFEKLKPYFDMIESHGIKLSDVQDMRDLMLAIKYTECRYSEPLLHDDDIAEKIGAKMATIARIKYSRYITAASRIVLAEFLTDETRHDARQQMFSIYQKYIPLALENVARIAACQMPDGVPKPAYKDQVAAFREFANNPMAQAWLTNTFIGEMPSSDEEEYLQIRNKLLRQKEVLKLDGPGIVEGEIVNFAESEPVPVLNIPPE